MLLMRSRKNIAFNTGYLPEQGGHSIYFHEYGNPQGRTVLIFHGGPGSCSKAEHARLFNLKKFRVILFDQRGRGKSLPSYETANNTLQDTLDDAKRILDFLSIKNKVCVYGGSWGSTVCLAFSQKYPELVERIIVSSTFLARKKDIEWIFPGTSLFYPDILDQLTEKAEGLPDIRAYFARMAFSGDKEDLIQATSFYARYEPVIGKPEPQAVGVRASETHARSFKLRMHYEVNDYWLKENQLLDNIDLIKSIPTLIVHNRIDMVCPLEQSWALHKAMPASRLIIVPDFGHDSALLEKTLKKEAARFMEECIE